MNYQKLSMYMLFALPTLSQAVYWEDQFSTEIYTSPTQHITTLQHHADQNYAISQDFLKTIQSSHKACSVFIYALENASIMLEVGCGSGEMLQLMGKRFPHLQMLGIDISHSGIKYANQQNKHTNIRYQQCDALNNSLQDVVGNFDIAICSNTLEHFKKPFVLLDNILNACDACIILVPYKQPVTDGYSMEGGAGHVFTFDEHSFADYTVLSWFTFRTRGWSYSSKGEEPLQLAILVTKK